MLEYTALDLLGFVADLANAYWYYREGNTFQMVASIISVIPGLGDAAKSIIKGAGLLAKCERTVKVGKAVSTIYRMVGAIAHSVNSVKNFNKMRSSLSSKDKTTLVASRGTNENIAQKLQQGYLPANYPNPNNAVTRVFDHSKPAVWVSEGKPNLFIRIFLYGWKKW